MKNIAKNKLIIKLLGSALTMPFRYRFFNNTTGNNTSAAITNLSNVSENGFIIPDNFPEDIKEPATSKVTNNANK
jgi:hypothetical protein